MAGKKVSRRIFLGISGKTVVKAAVLTGTGLLVGGAIAARKAAIKRDIAARTTSYRKAGIANPGNWGELTRYYKLDPSRKPHHRKFADTINTIAAQVRISPERVSLTIQKHLTIGPISDLEIAQTKKKAEKASGEEKKRLNRVATVLEAVQKEYDALNVLRTAPMGSENQVAKMIRRKAKN